jgi:hypothetical protein
MTTTDEAEAEYHHRLRQLVDEYRGDLSDRDLAVTTDAVRRELEHGNYQPAREADLPGGSDV